MAGQTSWNRPGPRGVPGPPGPVGPQGPAGTAKDKWLIRGLLLLLAILAAILLLHTPAHAQDSNFFETSGSISAYTVATLPVGQPTGTLAIVTDGSGYNCTAGGMSTLVLCYYNGTTWASIGPAAGAGTLTASGLSLPVNQIVLGNVYPDVKPLGSLGTTTTVYHGNAAGAGVFGAVVSADLNLTTTTCTNQALIAIIANGTGTCGSISNAMLSNQSTTVNSNTCTLGSSCTIGLGQIGNPAATTSFSYALNQGATVAMTGTATNSWTTDSATAQFINAKNTTPAVIGTSQGSPKMAICGRAFHGGADVEDCMTFGELAGNGNDAAITVNYGHTGTSTGVVTHAFAGAVQPSSLTASLPVCSDANKTLSSTCTGLVTVADLVSGATTVNGQTCTLGSSCTIPLSAVNAQTATYQVLAADFSNYKTITVASGTFTITLVASGSQPTAGQYIQIINYGSGVVTVARSGQNINGAAGNFTLSAGSATAPTSTFIESDGANYFAAIDEGTVGTITSVATTSPITGGTVSSGAVTVACATCATTTNGGALSGTSPVTVSVAGAIGCATCGVKLCSGTQALNTSAISSGSKSVVITISCTGITTSQMDFASDPSGVTGYSPSATGTLTVVKYITTNNLNIYVYNDTGSSVTPGAISVNYAGY